MSSQRIAHKALQSFLQLMGADGGRDLRRRGGKSGAKREVGDEGGKRFVVLRGRR